MNDEKNRLTGRSSGGELSAYERLLIANLKDVLSELYLIDCGVFVSYVLNEQHANIEDLVSSATELFFKEGTLCYSHGAEALFDWANAPVIVLDMEFVHTSTTVFFKLILNSFQANVSIHRIILDNRTGNAESDLKRFEGILADARIMSLSPP
ncbi:hypothetical protein [Microvirga flavescens]|uniref:hypothetical protein n=1 Tax=Microvirga flavescens TaxID=2249811 RepID=UPI000DDBAA47|nr:hypothetical protein [Microvirga flavescens]